ncbi:MAG TPA: hypothetical protein G4N92_01010 [Anaerolineae bacterium]|nr:hypothetical protein [Anaerolineae bacterium]
MSWIVGTIVIFVLHAIGTLPLARALSKGRVHESAAPAVTDADASQPQQDTTAIKVKDAIPTGIYILADVIVMGIAGFLIGLFTGYYFIGISLQARDWPGMIVFILSSLLGSSI